MTARAHTALGMSILGPSGEARGLAPAYQRKGLETAPNIITLPDGEHICIIRQQLRQFCVKMCLNRIMRDTLRRSASLANLLQTLGRTATPTRLSNPETARSGKHCGALDLTYAPSTAKAEAEMDTG